MIRFFRKLFKRGDFMTRADKAYYKYRAKTFFWSAFCLIIIAWVGTNLVLCALTTNVESNWDISYAPAKDVYLPEGAHLNINIKNKSWVEEAETVDKTVKTITFDYVGGESSAAVVGVEPEILNADDRIYLYRVNDGADVYILSPNHMHLGFSEGAFKYFEALTTINFKNFKYDGDSTREMFRDCSSLKSLDLSGWDTSLTYSFYCMFLGCSELEKLEGIEDWDTSNTELMDGMFSGCSNLSSLDLSGWDTSKVVSMSVMFEDCYSLTSLDLTGWDTNNVSDMDYMFADCYMLETIYASDSFVTDNLKDSTDMFYYCKSLMGGYGTGYDPRYTDATYAKIDKPGQRGYFTEW